MKPISFLIVFCSAIILGTESCKKEELSMPTVVTKDITNITSSAASGGGEVTSDGGTEITSRGICWSTSENPVIIDSMTSDGTGPGSFQSTISGLTSDTKYYVRAYATNIKGTSYGNQVSFTTLAILTGSFIDSRDGHEYSYVKIGTQTWMSVNLAYLPAVSPCAEGSYDTAYYYVYGYQGNNVTEAKATEKYIQYGVLYNWPAAMNGGTSSNSNPSGVQGVCPTGWHLPSMSEWDVLENYLGGWYESAGGKMKSTGTIQGGDGLWNSPNGGATNESGFSGLPAGNRDYTGSFDGLGYGAYWNSTTADTSVYNYSAYLEWSDASSLQYYGTKQEGFSVRCIKN
jgi:uncharacterized protein (TIGR02145 family)